MEPPTKRLKVGQAFYDAVEEEVQDELAMTPFQFDAHQDPMNELDKGRAKAATRLKSTFESIFEKYEKDFTDIGDEIDLETGEIIVNNGHIESMRDPNEDGTRSDDESISSAEEERILTGKSSDKSQSKSLVKATSSNGIGQESSNKWDIPIIPDHQLSSLAMAPSPFGAPPPFSFGPSFPSGQPAGTAGQAPNIPISLFQDNFGLRNQFMGYPGAVEYNSFGQVRIRSSYRNVFGQSAPKRFSTIKDFSRKALPAAASEETSDTDEDDILLGQPPADPEPVEMPAPSILGHPSAAKAVTTQAITSEASTSVLEDTDSTVDKPKRKRGRPRKNPPVNESTESHHETAINTNEANSGAPDVSSASTQSISHLNLASEPHTSQSPSKDLPPDEQPIAPPVEGPNRVPNDSEQADIGHRKSTRARKQPDFLGKRVFPKQKHSKQKVVESTTTTKDVSEEVVQHTQGVAQGSDSRLPDLTVPADAEDKQGEDATMHDVQVEDMPVDEPEASVNPEDEPQRTIQISEVPSPPISDNLNVEAHEDQSQQDVEAQDSSVPTSIQDIQDPVSSASNNTGDEIGNQDAVFRADDGTSNNDTSPNETVVVEDVNGGVRNPSRPINAAQCDMVGNKFKPEEPHAVDSVELDEPVENADAVSADEHQTVGTPETQKISQNEPEEAMSPDLSSRIEHETESGSQTLVEKPKKPKTARALRSREQSLNLTSNISPQSSYNVSDNAADTRDINSEILTEVEVTETPTTPKRRSRDLVIRESPPQAHDGKSTTTTAAGHNEKSDRVLAKSPTRRTDRALAAQKRKPPTPGTPETPKRKPRDRVAATAATTATTATATTATPTANRISPSNTTSSKKDTGKRKSTNKTPSSSTSSPTTKSNSKSKSKFHHLAAPPRRISLTSLIPDDPEREDELNILTPTSTTGSYTPTAITPSSSFRARLGLLPISSSSSNHHRRRHIIPATTPRRKYNSGLIVGGDGGSSRSGVQSSPLARTVAARSMLMATPRRPRAAGKRTSMVGGGSGSSPVAAAGEEGDEGGGGEDVVRTPGGSVQRCGEDGFVCGRAFCFTCCK